MNKLKPDIHLEQQARGENGRAGAPARTSGWQQILKYDAGSVLCLLTAVLRKESLFPVAQAGNTAKAWVP